MSGQVATVCVVYVVVVETLCVRVVYVVVVETLCVRVVYMVVVETCLCVRCVSGGGCVDTLCVCALWFSTAEMNWL